MGVALASYSNPDNDSLGKALVDSTLGTKARHPIRFLLLWLHQGLVMPCR